MVLGGQRRRRGKKSFRPTGIDDGVVLEPFGPAVQRVDDGSLISRRSILGRDVERRFIQPLQPEQHSFRPRSEREPQRAHLLFPHEAIQIKKRRGAAASGNQERGPFGDDPVGPAKRPQRIHHIPFPPGRHASGARPDHGVIELDDRSLGLAMKFNDPERTPEEGVEERSCPKIQILPRKNIGKMGGKFEGEPEESGVCFPLRSHPGAIEARLGFVQGDPFPDVESGAAPFLAFFSEALGFAVFLEEFLPEEGEDFESLVELAAGFALGLGSAGLSVAAFCPALVESGLVTGLGPSTGTASGSRYKPPGKAGFTLTGATTVFVTGPE
jgi:hypothetical protein